jgi:hypothetical protein
MGFQALVKGFPKGMTCPILWQLKKFGHHQIVAIYKIANEVFWSPFDTPPPSDGD